MTVDTIEPRHFEIPQDVNAIKDPGDYRFEFTGAFPLIDTAMYDFFTRNFPGLTPLRFSPARLSETGHYIPASLDPIEEWKRFDQYSINYLMNQDLADPEYYSINTGGSYSEHGVGTYISFSIKDIGRLSIGENKLRVQIEEPEGRDGEFQFSVSEGIVRHFGRVSSEGEHPGSLVRATRAYVNLFSQQGAFFLQER